MLIPTYKDKALTKNGNLIKLPYDKVLDNNSWELIKYAIDYGYDQIFDLGWYGQLKNFVGTDGNTYAMRLVDTQEGRYQRVSDGKYNKVVFALEYTPPTQYRMMREGGGLPPDNYPQTEVFTALESGDLWNLLPSDLKAIIEPYYIKCATEHSSTGYNNCSDVACKIFLPSLAEVGVRPGYTFFGYEKETESFKDGTYLCGYDYYVEDWSLVATKRIKNLVTDKTNPVSWWLRSPDNSVNIYWNGVVQNGTLVGGTYSDQRYISFCFAL